MAFRIGDDRRRDNSNGYATRCDEASIKSYTEWNHLSANFATFYEFSLSSILPRMGGHNRTHATHRPSLSIMESRPKTDQWEWP